PASSWGGRRSVTGCFQSTSPVLSCDHWSAPVSACFFFFQAEDGIRDRTVTGVQTCALPISLAGPGGCGWPGPGPASAPRCRPPRSEERRVGKECRSRGAPVHEKKKADEEQGNAQSSNDSAGHIRSSGTPTCELTYLRRRWSP